LYRRAARGLLLRRQAACKAREHRESYCCVAMNLPMKCFRDDGSVIANLRLASGAGFGEWIGDEQPKLSPKEPLAAKIEEDGLWLRHFDGTAKKIIPYPPEARMTLGRWSPDGQFLIFYQELNSDWDDLPSITPHGLTGFYLLH